MIGFVYFIVSAVLTLPWSVYADWWREKSYGRTSQPFSDWLLQLGIATILSTFLGALFLMGVYWLIRRAGRAWWIWSAALTAVALAFVMLLAPVLIEPLFNHYTPVPPSRVFMYNGSRQSNNFTANAGGVGSTARVAISDVALKNASLDEVRAVTGHEIGHYVLKHTWWGILFYSIGALILFWIVGRTFGWFARRFGSSSTLPDPRGLPVLMFMVTLFGVVTLPLSNTFSRTLEAQADMYSLQTENLPDALSTSLVKTAEYRYPRPGRLEEVIFYDHPSVESRVRTAMEWKAAHPGPAAP